MLGDALISSLDRLTGSRVLIVGDLMLDHYLTGVVERISPEAPVPVVRVGSERYVLGGAGNVARNIVALGGKPHLVSYAGHDDHCARLFEILGEESISCDVIQDENRATTLKTRVMANNQQIVRVDHESDEPLAEQMRTALLETVDRLIGDYDVVILSDYGKGMVSKEFMKGFNAILERIDHKPMILVDPKTQNFDLYSGVSLLTPNAKEAAEGSGTFRVNGKDLTLKAGLAIFKKLRCEHLLITLGGEGMAVFLSPGEVKHIPTMARKVFDVTGAGDTVIAVIALALASGFDLLTACVLANYAAGEVVGQVGAASICQSEIADAIRACPELTISSWLDMK